jgi:hypothetical protein
VLLVVEISQGCRRRHGLAAIEKTGEQQSHSGVPRVVVQQPEIARGALV